MFTLIIITVLAAVSVSATTLAYISSQRLRHAETMRDEMYRKWNHDIAKAVYDNETVTLALKAEREAEKIRRLREKINALPRIEEDR